MQPISSPSKLNQPLQIEPNKPQKAHTLETLNINTKEKVADYFPKTQSDLIDLKNRAVNDAFQGIKEVERINRDHRTFENTLLEIDKHYSLIYSRMQAIWVVSMTHHEKKVRDLANKCKNDLSNVIIQSFNSNKNLYEAIKDIPDSQLTPSQLKFKDEQLTKFKREGCHLNSQDFNKIESLKLELNEIESQFGKNLDEDKTHITVKKEDLKGLPEDFIDSLKKENNDYRLTCDYPTYFSVMRLCQVEETRKKLFYADTNMAKTQNLKILKELRDKRSQFAKLLGHKSFASYDTQDQMAKSPKTIRKFLTDLLTIIKDKSKKEIVDLLKYESHLVNLDKKQRFNPWDFSFIAAQFKKSYLKIDEVKIKEYFSFETTLNKMITLYSDIFEIEIKRIDKTIFWDKDVSLFFVHKDSKLIGHIVLDPFPRKGKYGHGRCVDVLSRYKNQPAVAVLLTNFPPPSKQTPSLLYHNDVVTLFHELGHAFHQLLGQSEIPSQSGFHVKSDFLELPSQILEELMWDSKILENLSSHYKTKEALPKELIEKKINSRLFLKCASYYPGQIGLALLALELFDSKLKNTDTHTIAHNIRKTLKPYIKYSTNSYQECQFRHLADSLYRSKYYSYLWAEVFAKDVYNHIKQLQKQGVNGWLKYRKEILEKGGSQDPNQLLKSFLGRKPSVEALKREILS